MNRTITLIGADTRFSASIAQLLKLKTNGRFALSDNGDILLIDADSLVGKKAAAQNLDERTILLTVSPELMDHSLVVKKPIKIDELLAVLEYVLSQNKQVTAANNSEIKEQRMDESFSNPFAKYTNPEYLKQVSEVRGATSQKEFDTTFSYWKERLSVYQPIESYLYDDFVSKMERAEMHDLSSIHLASQDLYYNMDGYSSLYLFNLLRDRPEDNNIYYFIFQNKITFLFSDEVVLSSLTVEDIILYSEVMKDDVKLKIIYSADELVQLFNEYHGYHYSGALAALSRTILLAAKGRIINAKDLTEPLGIMQSPASINTFIELPYAKEMNNIWCFRNVSLRETIDMLVEINPYHIFSYYLLCNLYGLFGTEVTEGKSKDQLDLNALLEELQKL